MRRSVVSFFVLLTGIASFVAYQLFFNAPVHFNEENFSEDLENLSKINNDFGLLSEYFIDVADSKSAVYAYELLKRTSFSSNIDQHLLGHVVGDELYKQEGMEGMRFCTDDFRNACSHTIVIGSLLEYGMEVFDRVNNICHKAPGGSGAYTMCFHGFGHGVLAYTAYNMEETVKLCDKVGTERYNSQETYECIGGAVMEMKDGIHDKELWEPQREKYVDADNPLSICQADYMPERAKSFCYSYITPYFFDAVGGSGVLPTPDIFPASFAFCKNETNRDYQLLCYRGFGKEFIVLAAEYDLEVMHSLSDDKLHEVVSWCDLADDKDGAAVCKLEVINSLYWGGENSYNSSIRYCSFLADDLSDKCFDQLYEMVDFFNTDLQYKKDFCSVLNENRINKCKAYLRI